MSITARSANYPLRAIHYHQGIYWLMEQPVFGYNTAHERVRIWPTETLIYRVRLPE